MESPGWKRVDVRAVPGYQFGILSNSEDHLVLTLRQSAQDNWPEGVVPSRGVATIAEGYSTFCVVADGCRDLLEKNEDHLRDRIRELEDLIFHIKKYHYEDKAMPNKAVIHLAELYAKWHKEGKS